MYQFDISKITFIFLVFTIIAGGESVNLLSCQMQYNLKNNIFFKHFIGLVLIFGLIMMEGGWEFNENITNNKFNWSNGNTLHTIGWAIILYILLILLSKMKFHFSLIMFMLILLIYILNTYKNNLKEKKTITEEQELAYTKIINFFITMLILIFIYGFIDYFLYQKKEYKNSFNLYKFFLGVNKCKSLN